MKIKMRRNRKFSLHSYNRRNSLSHSARQSLMFISSSSRRQEVTTAPIPALEPLWPSLSGCVFARSMWSWFSSFSLCWSLISSILRIWTRALLAPFCWRWPQLLYFLLWRCRQHIWGQNWRDAWKRELIRRCWKALGWRMQATRGRGFLRSYLPLTSQFRNFQLSSQTFLLESAYNANSLF